MTAKHTDVSGSETPEGTAADAASAPAKAEALSSHDANGKRPLWSRTINRVNCSIWKHDQKGETSFSISVYRSYLDRRNNEWKRVHYFDPIDLKDVRAITSEAEAQVLHLKGMTQAVDED